MACIPFTFIVQVVPNLVPFYHTGVLQTSGKHAQKSVLVKPAT